MEMMDITTEREFWKHCVLGDIYAVELMVEPGKGRTVIAARRCSRAEEQTHGALPVLTLHSGGDAGEYCAKNAGDFASWQPPVPNDEAVRRLIAAQADRDDAAREYSRIRSAERAQLKTLEKATETVMACARELATCPAPTPPLIALSEAPDLPDAMSDDPTTDIDPPHTN